MGKEFMPYSKVDHEKKTLIIFGENQSWEFDGLTFTPRPSEPKKLWEKLYDAYYSTTSECHRKFLHLAKEDHERVAQAAISHVLGVVESMTVFKTSDCSFPLISKGDLIKKLKEEGER